MQTSIKSLKRFVRNALLEINIDDVRGMRCAPASTHDISTCTIDGKTFYLKFSAAWEFEAHDPSLQILIEYLAYRIYGLYTDVSIPDEIHLVYDRRVRRIGIATRAVQGTLSIVNPTKLGHMMSQGVFVDVLLANWDVTSSGNYIVTAKNITRIDPGGTMTFRAQGGRKNAAWNEKALELDTMLSKQSRTPAANVLSFADAQLAANSFMEVPWSSIANEIANVDAEISTELRDEFPTLLKQWKDDTRDIVRTLRQRHSTISKHIEFMGLA